jgi:hypothetical protein
MSAQQTSVDFAPAAFAGLIADCTDADMLSYRNEEDDGEVRFGSFVSQGSDARGALLPDAQANVAHTTALGIVAHSHAYAKDTELGDDGLKTGAMLNVMRRGRIWVYVNESGGVQLGDAVRVMASTAVGDEGDVDGPGSWWGDTANGGDTVAITNGARWMSESDGPGLVLLEFNCDAMTFSND